MVRVIISSDLEDLEDSSQVTSGIPLSGFMEKQPGINHLRVQELKHNLGEDVIFSLPEVQTVCPLVRVGPLSSAAQEAND